jgi:quinol monooxygenase YgiN
MSVITKEQAPLTLINVFTVDPEKQDDLVRLLKQATEEDIRHRPGFISVNIHVSLDGSNVVNYAQWESEDDLRAMLADPQAQEHIRKISAIARSAPQLYSVASIVER